MDFSPAQPESGSPSVVPKIGKYEVIKELGKGATSAVYQAFDPFQNRIVAIKLVFPEALVDKEHGKRYRKLFLTESSLAGKLSHPHIVAIYDAVADEGASYLVMEFVDGTTLEQWAQVAVSTRKWAALNPKALRRDPLTVADVLKARPVVWPFTVLNICLVTDAGGAVVLTRADRAKDCAKTPVYVRGLGEGTEHVSLTQMKDLTFSEATRISGDKAFRMAGVGANDFQHIMLYDAFTSGPPIMLESLGFAKRGEGVHFFEEGRSTPGGTLPINTNGGGLSYTHSGMYGM